MQRKKLAYVFVTFLLALLLLCACGVDNGGNDGTIHSTNDKDDVLYSTESTHQTITTEPASTEPTHAHLYTEVVVNATCDTDGYTEFTCECGHQYVDNHVDKLGHDYDRSVTEATCTTDGFTAYSCAVCGHSYEGDVVNALGHQYKKTTTSATCTEGGYTTNVCSTCEDTYVSDNVEALGHHYEQKIVSATCTTNGYTSYKCTTCGNSYEDDRIDAYGHSWGEWEIIKYATILAQGERKHLCSVCGETETQTISCISTPSTSLNSPVDPTTYMVAPTEEDFGEFYDRAVELYNAIIENADELYLYFGGNAEYTRGKQEYLDFANIFESKVLCNRAVLVSSNYATGAFSVGSGLVRVTVNPSQTYDLAKKCYDINVAAGLYDGISEVDAITKINQWMINNISYELGHYDPMDVIQTGKAQCAGYAKLFYYLCANANIDAMYVTGCADVAGCGSDCYGCHAWNKVKVGGSWYYIDVCWNDGGNDTKYFLSPTLWDNRSIRSEKEVSW